MKPEFISDFQKKVDRNINVIKEAVKRLHKTGFTIESVATETMFGVVVNHVYLRDRTGQKICLQKYLFTLDERK